MGTDMALPLSHSSAMTLLSCEEKYAHLKVLKSKPDQDHEKSNALGLGSAVHFILERGKHEKPASITADLATCVADPAIGLQEEDVPLAHAMVIRYLRLHKRKGLRVLAVETEVVAPNFRGFIDAVMEDGDGNWHIVDVKTWKSVTNAMLKQLPRDAQLTLYAGFADVLAEQLGLPLEKFSGVRWRVITKSTAKRKRNEEYVNYVMRLVEAVRAYDIPVPKAMLDIPGRLTTHQRLWERSLELQAGATPLRNFKSCFDFYSPCEFFSHCFGRTFSEALTLDITEE